MFTSPKTTTLWVLDRAVSPIPIVSFVKYSIENLIKKRNFFFLGLSGRALLLRDASDASLSTAGSLDLSVSAAASSLGLPGTMNPFLDDVMAKEREREGERAGVIYRRDTEESLAFLGRNSKNLFDKDTAGPVLGRTLAESVESFFHCETWPPCSATSRSFYANGPFRRPSKCRSRAVWLPRRLPPLVRFLSCFQAGH